MKNKRTSWFIALAAVIGFIAAGSLALAGCDWLFEERPAEEEGPDDPGYDTSGPLTWHLSDDMELTDCKYVKIAYGNGRFVAIGSYIREGYDGLGNRAKFYTNKAAYSEDGISWTGAGSIFQASYFKILDLDSDPHGYGIAFGDGKFVAGGPDHNIRYSADGINWTEMNDIPGAGQNYFKAMTYGGGKFVAGGTGTYCSTDGINWTGTKGIDSRIGAIAYGSGKFVAGGDTVAYYSTDGINWTKMEDLEPFGSSGYQYTGYYVPFDIYDIAYGSGKFVAWGQAYHYPNMAYSADGINWTALSDMPFSYPENIKTIAYGGGRFIAGGTDGANKPRMAYSEDGISWTKVEDHPFNANIVNIVYGGGRFVAVDGNGDMYYTTGK